MFISFEGIDGSGKSTQAHLLSEALQADGHDVLNVREPGGTILGESIRSLILDPDSEITPRAELLLFSAARAHLVETVIRPALTRGTIVIADRFFDSTTAYQGAGRDLATHKWLAPFHAFVTDSLMPDRTYLLRLDPAIALKRAGHRSVPDRMEQSDGGFFKRIASSYDQLVISQPERILALDATETPKLLHALILEDVRDRYGSLHA